MSSKHLEMSPEFAAYLSKNGLLDALSLHYKRFKEQQYFPFREKDKRVTKLALWKGLCEIVSTRTEEEKKKNPMTPEDILNEVDRLTVRICPDINNKPADFGFVPKQKTVAQINAELQIEANKELEELPSTTPVQQSGAKKPARNVPKKSATK